MPSASASSTRNPIQIENALPGSSGWQLEVLSYHREIEGYASSPSYRAGQAADFFVSTTATSFHADVYRMGWYGGAGARLVDSVGTFPGFKRAVPKPDSSTGLIACHWGLSFQITIPKQWLSGIYLVKLTGSNTHQAYIPFTIVDPTSNATYVFVHGVFTDEAYNTWGSRSLYADIDVSEKQQYAGRAVKVTFQRPFEQSMGAGWFLSWEIHMVRYLERNGYDVTYTTDLDVHEHPGALRNHRAILVVGHDEYWSRNIRNGMANAVAHGVNLADFAANTGYWQVRLEPLGGVQDRVIVCYKTSPDPERFVDKSLVTTEWRNSPVNRPESELTGAMYGGFDGVHAPYPFVVTDPSSWVFAGTGLKKGSRIPGIVGQEADTVVPGYRHPPGLQVLSSSPFFDVTSSSRLQAKATVYRAHSGAWVFDAASIEWSWGLDDVRQNFWLYPAYPSAPSPAAEAITRNILARFAH
jgi:hypothetical protein